jgi:hypothetical protein
MHIAKGFQISCSYPNKGKRVFTFRKGEIVLLPQSKAKEPMTFKYLHEAEQYIARLLELAPEFKKLQPFQIEPVFKED